MSEETQRLRARNKIRVLAPEGYGYEDIARVLKRSRIKVCPEWLRTYIIKEHWKDDDYSRFAQHPKNGSGRSRP